MPGSKRFEGAALTPIATWRDLISVIPFGDQANTLCLFAIKPENDAHERLLATLRADNSPRLETVLETDDDIFAVITQEDEGLSRSSLLIAGRGRLRNRFPTEAARLDNRLDNYFSETAAAGNLEDWRAAVDRLADLKLPQE
jgi:hypothetical protein